MPLHAVSSVDTVYIVGVVLCSTRSRMLPAYALVLAWSCKSMLLLRWRLIMSCRLLTTWLLLE